MGGYILPIALLVIGVIVMVVVFGRNAIIEHMYAHREEYYKHKAWPIQIGLAFVPAIALFVLAKYALQEHLGVDVADFVPVTAFFALVLYLMCLWLVHNICLWLGKLFCKYKGGCQ